MGKDYLQKLWLRLSIPLLLFLLVIILFLACAPRMSESLQVLGIIGTLSTIILGVIAIWLSIYFYSLSNQLNASLGDILSRIEAVSEKTESTLQNVLAPTMEMLLSVMKSSMEEKVGEAIPEFARALSRTLKAVQEATSEEEKQAATKALFQEFDTLARDLKLDIERTRIPGGAYPFGSSMEARVDSGRGKVGPRSVIDWLPFIRRMRNIEVSNRFVGLKRLRDETFASDPRMLGFMQLAVDQGILRTCRRENPKDRNYPTLCCALNQEHPTVKECLQAIEKERKGA